MIWRRCVLASKWKSLIQRASVSLENLQDKFIEEKESNGETTAWGQYLNPPRHREHNGVYGTASAIQILSLSDSRDYSDEIEGGKQWLLQEWMDADSRSNRRGHQYITYKLAYTLLGLHSQTPLSSTEWAEDEVDPVSQLQSDLENYQKDWGWGEYGTPDQKADPQLDTTALVLLAQLCESDQPRALDEDFHKLSQKAQERFTAASIDDLEEDTELIVGVALSLIALSSFAEEVQSDLVPRSITDGIDRLAADLRSVITRSEIQTLDPNTFEINLFSLPTDSIELEDLEDDQYKIFIVYPIIAYSLLKAGDKHISRNWKFIQTTAETYIESLEISDIDAFISESTGKASTVDQLWVAMLLHEFQETDPTTFDYRDFLRGQLSSEAWDTVKGTLLLLVLLAVAFLLSLWYPNNLWANALLTVLLGVTANVVGSLRVLKKWFW